MKKLILKFPVLAVLAGLVLVFSQSAFTSAPLIQKNVYTLSPDGLTYTLDNTSGIRPVNGDCTEELSYTDCVISYSDLNKPTTDEFPANDIPANGEHSGEPGYWAY